jgi:aspartyl-tRNA(Asn)/glutamyl-tRNA(Gln) amidotransferase subunit C
MGRTQHKLKVYDCARFFSTFRPCFGASRFIRERMRETGAASCRAPFMSLTREHVESIAHLARLAITQDELPAYVDSLSRILSFVEQLNAVEARDVEPMAHPLAGQVQRLRPDEPEQVNSREKYQANAPCTEAGLYLVPKVIE